MAPNCTVELAAYGKTIRDATEFYLDFLKKSNATVPVPVIASAVRAERQRRYRWSETWSRIIQETKPEAIYFTEQQGGRGAVMIVDMSGPSKIPALAEPWFLTFNASVEFRVVMTPDDLKKASLEEVGKKWG